MELKVRGLKDVWTGFIDRNGVEVYEGDILKVREPTGADSYEDVLMEPVQFVEGSFVCGSYVAEWTLLRRWLIRWARDTDHAVKIAQDRRAEYLAKKEGVL